MIFDFWRSNKTGAPGNRPVKAHAFTVSDNSYYPGTLALLNSVQYCCRNLNVAVCDCGLSPKQVVALRDFGVKVISGRDIAKGRYLGGWELKAYASEYFLNDADIVLGLDSDLVLCSDLSDILTKCQSNQVWLGGEDGTDCGKSKGTIYSSSYRIYGIRPGSRGPYMSTAVFFFPVNRQNTKIVSEWAACCNKAEFNSQGPFPGYSDQGVLNACLYARNKGRHLELLTNNLWTQHWTFWEDHIEYRDRRFFNVTCASEQQRAFHSCCSAPKFWTCEMSQRARASSTPLWAYLWFLTMLWHGKYPFNIDLAEPMSKHLETDRVFYETEIKQLINLIPTAPTGDGRTAA